MAKTKATTETETQTVETPKTPKVAKRGVGTVARELLRKGLTNEQVLAGVLAEFPDANTSLASINWYRNDLRQKGEDVPSGREAQAAFKASQPQATEDAEATNADAGDEDLGDDADEDLGDDVDEDLSDDEDEV